MYQPSSPLKPAEDTDGEHFQSKGSVERAPDQEPDEGQREGNADDAPKQTMRVFQPVNFLEPGEGHAPIDFLIFGEALVIG